MMIPHPQTGFASNYGVQAALTRISRPVSADDVAHMLAEQNRQSAKEPTQ